MGIWDICKIHTNKKMDKNLKISKNLKIILLLFKNII